MIATQERTIDGMKFTVTQLPAMKGLRTLNRIGRVLGPAFAKVAGASGSGNVTDMDLSKLGDAVEALFERLTDDELEQLTRELLAQATCDGKLLMPQFDLILAGKVDVILQLLRFAFEVNYGNFFAGLAGMVAAGQAKPSPSPTMLTTPGPAGVS